MPTQGAVVIVTNPDREVLLHKREDFRVWTLPGGHIEPGETWQEAAVREAYEETGYQVAIDDFVGEYWSPQLPGGGNLTCVCRGHVVGGAPLVCGPETLAVRWVPPTALPRRLSPFARSYIADAFSDAPRPIKRTVMIPAYQALLLRSLFRLRDLRNRVSGRP